MTSYALAILGGVLIGVSATLLMALNGRVAGVSGITAGLLSLKGLPADWPWRLAFVAGLIIAPLAVMRFHVLPPATFPVGMPGLTLAGLLVGIGTVTGNGCTSGHGVCGLARLSPRSAVATAVFIVAGMLTVFFIRHVF